MSIYLPQISHIRRSRVCTSGVPLSRLGRTNPLFLASRKVQKPARIEPWQVHNYLKSFHKGADRFEVFIDWIRDKEDCSAMPEQITSYEWRIALIEYMLNGFSKEQLRDKVDIIPTSDDTKVSWEEIIFHERVFALEILLNAPEPYFRPDQAPIKPLVFRALEILLRKEDLDPLKVSLITRICETKYECRLSWQQRARLLRLADRCKEEIILEGKNGPKKLKLGEFAFFALHNLFLEKVISTYPSTVPIHQIN